MINTHDNNEKHVYEVWALGYDQNNNATNVSVYLGVFQNKITALEFAQKFGTSECISHQVGDPDYNPILNYYPEEGHYLVVRVEDCVQVSSSEVCCVDVLWEAAIQ